MLVTRRDFGRMLGAAATTVVSRLAAQSGRAVLKAQTFNHLAMAVSDVRRSADWYQRCFGLPVRLGQDASGAQTALLRIGAGPEFLELVPTAGGAKPGFLHIGIGVQNFTRVTADRVLAERGVKAEWRTRKAAGGDVEELLIHDPDGLAIQIQDTRYTAGGGPLGDQWSQPWPTPPQGAAQPVQVRCINHATFGSSSKERAEKFYAELFDLRLLSWDYRPREPSKILGFVADSPRQFLAPGQGALGISHYCLGVESFDRARVVKLLSEVDVAVQPAGSERKACCGSGLVYSPGETAFLRDPDGISVQLTDMDYCAGTGPIGVIPAL